MKAMLSKRSSTGAPSGGSTTGGGMRGKPYRGSCSASSAIVRTRRVARACSAPSSEALRSAAAEVRPRAADRGRAAS
jgi:hypothetical protein